MKFAVTVYDEIWRSIIVEAESKSEARQKAAAGEGVDLDWGPRRRNIRAPGRAVRFDSEPSDA
jgi:hypothetical protein